MSKSWHKCSHLHVSGRACRVGIPWNLSYCLAHTGDNCRDCQSMMDTFKPPKGWKR